MQSVIVAAFIVILGLGSVAAKSSTHWPCAFSTAYPGVAATSPLLLSGCRGLPLLHQLRSSHSPFRSTSLTVQATKGQVYTIPTYNAAFKYVLSSERVRTSFLSAFLPDVVVTSSERLDEHMNPAEGFQLLRHFLHDANSSSTAKNLIGSNAYVARPVVRNSGNSTPEKDEPATAFLHEIVERFDEIKNSFPMPSYAGTMDFACRLNNGDFVLVEMQILQKDNFDRRALAYVSAFYGNQLRKGGKWKNVKKVFGINILGGGKENIVWWKDSGYMRHYRFQDVELKDEVRYMDGIQIMQYSIMNAPIVNDQEKNDWLTFFKHAASMTEEQVDRQIQTPAVLLAFDRAKISKLPVEVLEAYEAEDEKYDEYSEYTANQIALATEDIAAEAATAKAEAARNAAEAARNAAEQIATAKAEAATAKAEAARNAAEAARNAAEQIATAKAEAARNAAEAARNAAEAARNAAEQIATAKAEAAQLAQQLARYIPPGTT
jgi:predicted transposase/invertase (TIGR01784 family)